MASPERDKKPSVGDLLSGVVQKMLRLQPVVEDRRSQNLAQKRANIRAVGVREKFQTMRARSDEMTRRLEYYRRKHATSFGKDDDGSDSNS